MPTSRPKRPAHILVVDDDEGLQFLMSEALAAEGHEVTTAASGEEVIASLSQRVPDLMLLDFKLRDIDGQRLLEQLGRKNLAVPFIVVTGQGDEKVAVEMMRRGALDYVNKDTSMIDLLPGVVARALTTLWTQRELERGEVERERLEKQVLEISEAEQQRIGADLHDGLGQQLTAIEIFCTGLRSDVEDQPELAKQVDRIRAMLRESVAQVRMLARGLVPVENKPDALWASLVELAARTQSLGRVECVFACAEPVLVADHVASIHLYRIAQEAVNNALKHAQARKITLALRRDGDQLELSIADDGSGFFSARGAGVGLQVMRHRAHVIRADLSVSSAPEQGTVVSCRLSSAL